MKELNDSKAPPVAAGPGDGFRYFRDIDGFWRVDFKKALAYQWVRGGWEAQHAIPVWEFTSPSSIKSDKQIECDSTGTPLPAAGGDELQQLIDATPVHSDADLRDLADGIREALAPAVALEGETPRVDAEAGWIDAIDGTFRKDRQYSHCGLELRIHNYVRADFARQLERELAAADKMRGDALVECGLQEERANSVEAVIAREKRLSDTQMMGLLRRRVMHLEGELAAKDAEIEEKDRQLTAARAALQELASAARLYRSVKTSTCRTDASSRARGRQHAANRLDTALAAAALAQAEPATGAEEEESR